MTIEFLFMIFYSITNVAYLPAAVLQFNPQRRFYVFNVYFAPGFSVRLLFG